MRVSFYSKMRFTHYINKGEEVCQDAILRKDSTGLLYIAGTKWRGQTTPPIK